MASRCCVGWFESQGNYCTKLHESSRFTSIQLFIKSVEMSLLSFGPAMVGPPRRSALKTIRHSLPDCEFMALIAEEKS